MNIHAELDTLTVKYNNATITQIDTALANVKGTLAILKDVDNDCTDQLWLERDFLVTLKAGAVSL